MRFTEYSPFVHEYGRLYKRFPSLDQDIEKIKKFLIRYPMGSGGKNWNILHKTERVIVFKTRLACMYLRSSALRLVYAHSPDENRIDFIEVYFKGDKEAEDKQRIKEYLKGL
ncbi:MAG: hypothetical protein ACYC6X_02280 [Minisyncoccota bacterium]